MARNTARNTSAMAKEAGKAKPVESTIAKLESRTDTPTVRAARPAALKTGANFTGQYLYDRFVNDKAENKEDVTKMDIVRQMAEVLDTNGFDTVVAGMVNVAKTAYDAAITAAKDAKTYDSDNPSWPVREAKARLNTARSHQTVMRYAFGALKFCADELKAKIGDAPLAYRMIRDIGAKLLSDKGIDWKGNKVEAPEAKASRKQQELETSAMLAVQKEYPRKEGESRADSFVRIDAATEKKMKELEEDNRIKARTVLADKIRQMCGSDLPDIIDLLTTVQPESTPAVTPKADAKLH